MRRIEPPPLTAVELSSPEGMTVDVILFQMDIVSVNGIVHSMANPDQSNEKRSNRCCIDAFHSVQRSPLLNFEKGATGSEEDDESLWSEFLRKDDPCCGHRGIFKSRSGNIERAIACGWFRCAIHHQFIACTSSLSNLGITKSITNHAGRRLRPQGSRRRLSSPIVVVPSTSLRR